MKSIWKIPDPQVKRLTKIKKYHKKGTEKHTQKIPSKKPHTIKVKAKQINK